jgi:sugar/nucleoside kinase (ribokinase family)
MNGLRPIKQKDHLYKRIVGTGGIGTGLHFSLTGNETLGRNESRLATLLPFKDFCKQHIILHYVAVLLDARASSFSVHPIGKVGNDDAGHSLLRQMAAVGMDTKHVAVVDDARTLFSVCFEYPDKSGGNITTGNSASGLVTPGEIDKYFSGTPATESEIVLAVPEVPVDARLRLLEWGRRRNALNIASVLSGEVREFSDAGGFANTDLLSINIDEAKNIASARDGAASGDIVRFCIDLLLRHNASISVLITDGARGVHCFTEGRLTHYPVVPVNAVSTAGAGDAFLAGTICGLCCGLSLSASPGEVTAVEIGLLVAALSVTSADTINESIHAETLREFAASRNINIGI